MIVRIRFGRGRLVTTRRGKNGRAARLLASLLTLVSISFAVFGFWRLGEDLGIAGDFVFPTGLLSHWQVWVAAAASTQYVCWRLTRYSKLARREAEETDEEKAVVEKLTARV
jgi:hypothetical protein